MERFTDEELRELAQGPESPTVERKRELSAPDDNKKAQRALCAFANDILGLKRPGVLFVGLDDAGRPIATSVTDKLLTKLGNFMSGDLLPRPEHEVRLLQVEGGQCAVITIQPFRLPPVRFNGDVWVRRGPQTVKATPEEERQLAERGRAANLPFEVQPVPGAREVDLDPLLASLYIERVIGAETRAMNSRPLLHQLLAHRLVVANGTPTHAGLLLVGREPGAFLPSAYIQVLRHDGTDRNGTIVDQHRFSGPLLSTLDPLLALVEAWNPQPMDLSGHRHVVRPALPPWALREALLNAVIHRDYELRTPIYVRWFTDRVEVHSPGGPYPPVTPENLQAGIQTGYRNERLAEAMMRLGYVERFGLGISRIRRAMADNHNPEPEFDAGREYVRIILHMGR